MTRRFMTLCPISCLLLLFLLAPAPLCRPDQSGDDGGQMAFRAPFIFASSFKGGKPRLIENGVVLVRDGKIVRVGSDLVIPPGVPVVTFRDGVIFPGLVAASPARVSYNPGEETVSAKYRAIDAFDPYADYSELLAGGITTIYLAANPDRLVSGRGAVVKTAGSDPQERILDRGSDFCLNLTERSYNPGGLQKYPLPASSIHKIEPATIQRPSSRLGQILELKEAFQQARDYAGSPFDYNLEVLAAALAEPPVLRITAERAVDIEAACALVSELGMEAYLQGCSEAHRVAGQIAASRLGVVLEIPFRPGRPLDELGIDPGGMEKCIGTAARLVEKGIPVALSIPTNVASGELMQAAYLAVSHGMPEEKALAAVTSTAARLLSVDNRVGTLAPGMDADFLVLSSPPLNADSHVRKVYINGKPVFSNPMGRSALVVRAGTVLPVSGPPILCGEVLVEDGVIQAVGHTVPHPPGALIVDEGPDSVVTPGFIDGHGHLGLEGDRSVPDATVPIHRAVAAEQENFRPVAAAGVTTVILAPRGSSSGGSRVAAVKTAGKNSDALLVDDLAAVKLSFRGKDPKLSLSSLQKPLKAGKGYFDAWNKYYEALEKWKKTEAEKKAAEKAGKKKVEKKEEKKESKTVTEEEKVEEKPDPLSGTWEGTLSGDPLPSPQKVVLKLLLDKDTGMVTGTASSPMSPEEVEISGSLSGNRVVLEIQEETPMGAPTLEAEIDKEDHMTGVFKLGDAFSFQFEADRTEKEAPVIKITSRKKKVKDGKPEAPKINEALEPYRKLFAKEIPVLVEVNTHQEIEAAIKVVVEEYKLPLVLLGAGSAHRITEKIVAAKSGVVAALPLLARRDGKPCIQAIELSRAGIPVIFQSDAEDGARSLPGMAVWAVRKGMDATTALEALTYNAAKLFHVDDRVGSLQPGRDGDLVIFSGDPLNGTSRVLRVFVAGKEIEP